MLFAPRFPDETASSLPNRHDARRDLRVVRADRGRRVQQPRHLKRAKGDLDSAIADFSKAITPNPEFAAAYNNRGVVEREKSDLAAAIADFTKAIELDARLASAYASRANIRNARGDTAGAEADRRQAAAFQAGEPEH